MLEQLACRTCSSNGFITTCANAAVVPLLDRALGTAHPQAAAEWWDLLQFSLQGNLTCQAVKAYYMGPVGGAERQTQLQPKHVPLQ